MNLPVQERPSLRVILAEDEAVIATDVHGRLRRLGYDVVAVVRTGEEAVERTLALRPDIALFDITLHGVLDGIEAAVRIHESFDLPVIFTTASTDESTFEQSRRAGPYGFVLKPYEDIELHLAIQIAVVKHDAERRARSSEARYRLLFETNSAGVLLTSMTGQILDFNRALQELLGYTDRDSLLRKNMAELYVDPMARSLLLADLRKTGRVEGREVHCWRCDGTTVWGLVNLIHTGDGVIVSTAIDISERKKAEADLASQQRLMKLVLDTIPDAVYVKDRDLRFLLCNRAVAHMRGKALEGEVIGRTDADLLPQQEAKALADGELALLEGGSAILNHEESLVDAAGTQRWLLTTKIPVHGAEGDIVGLVGVARDITARRRYEEMLREQVLFQQSLLDAIPMPVSYRDAAGHYLGCNAAFERLSGLRRDAIMGKALPSPFTGDDPVGDLPSESGPAARPGMLTREVTTLDADGHPRRGQLHAATFVDEGGAAEGIIEVFVDLSAQRALQEELTRSERRYRAMFDRSHAVMILVDPDTGTIVGANPAAVTYYGYSREEFIGKSIQEINVSPHQQIRDGMVRARTGSQGHFSWQHRLASGDVRTVDVYSGPVELDGRELLFSIVHDVTARRRTEEALRISEERFRIIAESVPDMIAILTPDGQFEYASPAFRVLGIESEALPGSPFLDIVETTDGPRVREALHEAERTLQSQSVEHQVRGVAGVTRIVETSVTVQIDDAGQRIITVSRDITERRRRDQIVRKLSSAVEHSPTSIIITDVRGTIEYVNPSFCRVTGYAPEEVIGRNPRLLKSGESMAEEYGRLWKTITSGQTWHGRFANRKKDGSIFWERATISPITGANGAITHFVAVKEDVSEQIRQEQERLDLDRELRKRNEALERMVVELRQVQDGLVQSEKMASIGQLTAGIAHEINNPLAFVASNLNRFSEYFEDLLALFRGWRGLAERLPGGPAEEAERTTLRAAEAKVDIPFVTEDFQRLMGHTREGTDRIKRIVEQLRGFTHLSGNGYVEANINDALEDTVMITWNELKYKTTVVRAYGEIPLVSCNVGELKQVFVNLLVNAAHAIPEKGEIRLATAAQGDQVVIEIQDTGGGIPATHLTKIFDPFFTTKPVGQGTGLGLWISATLVRKHRGTISVQSEVGKGTTFTITIPVQVKETLEATP